MRGLRVGACQTPEILGDVASSLACIEDFAERAGQDVDILLFPECFLQGYLVDEEHLARYAMNLRSEHFGLILQRLSGITQALVFGVIEEDDGRHFNTAVVVVRGALVGIYRKNYLVPGESLFSKGDAYPVFELRGVKFGINICYDTQFDSAAAAVANQGAQLLLVPAQNMMRKENAEHWKDLHHEIRARRARETGMWLVSSDVTGERDNARIGYGPTSVLSPAGEVVAQVPLMTTGMAVADVAMA
jgi:predicted amidohydrolase